MLITVQTVSARLNDILTNDQVKKIVNSREGSYQVIVQNLGDQDLYYEFGGDASVSESIRIKKGETVSIVTQSLSLLNIVSDGAPNNNVRIASK